jgi:hypothetical protein
VNLSERIRAGTATDAEFDALYPSAVRAVSAACWSPLDVVRLAVEMLRPATRVVDVGSGAGKFCIAASVLAPDVRFTGVERCRDLVSVAVDTSNRVCDRLPFPGFRHGKIEDIGQDEFDGFYFYNPFGPGEYDRRASLEGSEAEARRVFLDDVARTVALLGYTARGTRVLTCCGFGGEMPVGFYLERVETLGLDRLELWVHDPDVLVQDCLDAVPLGIRPDERARLLVERYCHLPVTRQGLIGLSLGLLSEEEYQTCSRSTIDSHVLVRAQQRGQTLDLERAVYAHAPRVAPHLASGRRGAT